MTLNLILYIIIAVSIVGLGIIVFRKMPVLSRLSDEEIIILSRKKGLIQRIKELDYKQHWLNFIIGLEKFLRRGKIISLKTENLLGRWSDSLRRKSQLMAQKSKEWIKHKEAKRREVKESPASETKHEISVKIDKEEESIKPIIIDDEEADDLPISELKKPIEEEQKWINLIVENPQNITAYKLLGLLYWKQHNYTDAKASLGMAVRLGSRDKKVSEVLEELKKMGVK